MDNKNGPAVTVRFNSVIMFLGLVILLIGIFASARTIINFSAFGKYPTTGVLNLSPFGFPLLSAREEDCIQVGASTYFTQDNKPRPPTDDEKISEKRNYNSCVGSVIQSREAAKANDISLSLLLLILGSGLLISNRFLFR